MRFELASKSFSVKNSSLTAKQKVVVKRMVLILISIVGIGMLTGGFAGLKYTDKVSREYEPVTAKIENIKEYPTTSASGKMKTAYHVTVSYQVDGEDYQTLLGSYSSSMKTGQEITLHYNPRDPSTIVSVEINKTIWTILMVVGGILLVLNFLVVPRLLNIALENNNQ